MDSVTDVLDRLAMEIAEDLKKENVSLDQKLKAFQILSAREAQLSKKASGRRSTEPDNDDDGDEDTSAVPDFEAMRRKIHKVG